MTIFTILAVLGNTSPGAMWGFLGVVIGVAGTLAIGVGKHKNESAQVAIDGLQALVVQQAATIGRLEARVKYLEERVETYERGEQQ